MFKKLVSFSCVCVLCFISCTSNIFASDTMPDMVSSTTNITTNGMIFDIEVPSELPVYMDNYGEISVADDVAIVNNSGGMVVVNNVDIYSAYSWSLVPYDTDLTGLPINSQMFSVSLNGSEYNSTDGIDVSDWGALAANGGTLPLEYDIRCTPLVGEVSGNISTISIDLEWYDQEEEYCLYINVPDDVKVYRQGYTFTEDGTITDGAPVKHIAQGSYVFEVFIFVYEGYESKNIHLLEGEISNPDLFFMLEGTDEDLKNCGVINLYGVVCIENLTEDLYLDVYWPE